MSVSVMVKGEVEEQVRSANSRGYIVVRRSAEEIQSRMHAMALDGSPF